MLHKFASPFPASCTTCARRRTISPFRKSCGWHSRCSIPSTSSSAPHRRKGGDLEANIIILFPFGTNAPG